MRSLMLAAIAALSFASISHAADAPGPYKLDSKGSCHAANGQFAKKSLCAAPAAPAPSKVCGKSHIAANKTCHK